MFQGFALVLCLQQESPLPAREVIGPREPNPLEQVEGSLSMKYRARWTGGQSDSDLYEFLQLRIGDPAKDPFTLSSSSRFAEDLDGHQHGAGYSPFASLDDAYARRSTARLYTLYGDLNQPLPGLQLRGGRQVLDELPEAIPMDGGTIRFTGQWLSLGAFGGVPVNLFESSTRGDAMYGGWLEVDPWRRALFRVEELHIRDENLFGLFDNNLLGLSAEQGFGDFRAQARYTNLQGENRDVTGRLTGTFADLGLILNAQVTYLFAHEEALSYALDPYSTFLMAIEPYVEWTVRASQALGAAFGVDLVATQRKFVRGSEDATYNHEFVHASVTPHASDWPIPGLSIALSADYWRSTGNDYWTSGADLSIKIHPLVTIGAGTSYALYSIDALTGEEHDRVRTLYGSLRWKFPPHSVLDLRITQERNSIDTFYAFEVGARHDF